MEKKSSENKPGKGKEEMQLIIGGKRLDGRGFEDLRPIKIQAGVLEKANGSASIEWGRNKIIAGVYGPREVLPKHRANPYKAIVDARYSMASFSSLEEHGRAGPNRRAIEIGKIAKHVFENAILTNQFPNTQIEVSIEILQSDGGTRIAGITAASVALADAGIPMKDLVCGVSVGKVDGQLVVDLDKYEDNLGESDMPIVVSPRSKEILLFQMDGMLTKEEVRKSVDLAFEAAERIRGLQDSALKEKYEAAESAALAQAPGEAAAAAAAARLEEESEVEGEEPL